jgi:hypothetical protein
MFSPEWGTAAAIVREINRAGLKFSCSLRDYPDRQGLLDAHKKGVNVQVILDKNPRRERYSFRDVPR